MRGEKKRERRRLIESVLKEREVPTQAELVLILRSMGCEATQTSVARDFVEMGVQKVRGLYGRARYMLPRDQAHDPELHAFGTLRAFCTHIDVAGTIALVGTSLGAASTVGTAVDGLRCPDIVASVSGYDVVALFCRDAEKAESVRQCLETLRNR